MTISSFDDTIVAAATVAGTGAISIIRVSGRDAVTLVDGIVDTPLAGAKGYSVHFGRVIDASGVSGIEGKQPSGYCCPPSPGIEGKQPSGHCCPPSSGIEGKQPSGHCCSPSSGIEGKQPSEQIISDCYPPSSCNGAGDGCLGTKDVLDEVLITIFRAPKSYTGEDCVEISCHSSSYIVSRIIFLLIEAGARQAEPGEFTQRAFLAGKMDLTQAEAVADVIASQNAAAHRIAMNQMRGGFSNELQKMRGKLLEMTSLIELELDFSEEEVEFADRSVLRDLLDQVLSHIERLRESFRLGNAIKNGVPVAIAGSVNTGKSTLLNALLGEDRAIVSDIPGTTRDTVEDTIIIGGLPFRLIDTAGIRETSEEIEKIGIQRSFSKISSADIVLGVIDYSKSLEVNLSDTKELVSKVNLSSQNLIILLNKTDILGDNKNVKLINKDVLLSQLKQLKIDKSKNLHILEISAKTGSGLSELKEMLKVIEEKRESTSDSILVSNVRHFEALGRASQNLEKVKKALELKIPTDLISQDLREAIYHIGTITGEISTDEVLGEIFGKFCIGK